MGNSFTNNGRMGYFYGYVVIAFICLPYRTIFLEKFGISALAFCSFGIKFRDCYSYGYMGYIQ